MNSIELTLKNNCATCTYFGDNCGNHEFTDVKKQTDGILNPFPRDYTDTVTCKHLNSKLLKVYNIFKCEDCGIYMTSRIK